MPRLDRQPNPLFRKYLKADGPRRAEAKDIGDLRAVAPAARRSDGAPLLGDGQVYVLKHGTEFHTAWCTAVDEKWRTGPRGLLVTSLDDVGGRSPCTVCAVEPAAPESATTDGPGTALEEPASETVIPLRVVGVAHGIVFLAAGQEHRELFQETAVEPATPLSMDGRRDGMVVRLDPASDEPLVVVQLDPRVTFEDGPYQLRVRAPLQRSATKPYAVAAVEPAG